MSDEESTCVIYHTKAFAHEVNQNNLDINRLKTFVIQSSIVFFFYIRFIHRMIIIQKILDDIQQENQSMEMNQHIMLVSKLK